MNLSRLDEGALDYLLKTFPWPKLRLLIEELRAHRKREQRYRSAVGEYGFLKGKINNLKQQLRNAHNKIDELEEIIDVLSLRPNHDKEEV